MSKTNKKQITYLLWADTDVVTIVQAGVYPEITDCAEYRASSRMPVKRGSGQVDTEVSVPQVLWQR